MFKVPCTSNKLYCKISLHSPVHFHSSSCMLEDKYNSLLDLLMNILFIQKLSKAKKQALNLEPVGKKHCPTDYSSLIMEANIY